MLTIEMLITEAYLFNRSNFISGAFSTAFIFLCFLGRRVPPLIFLVLSLTKIGRDSSGEGNFTVVLFKVIRLEGSTLAWRDYDN